MHPRSLGVTGARDGWTNCSLQNICGGNLGLTSFFPFIAKDVTTENSAERTFFSGADRWRAPSYPFPEMLLGW